VTLGLAFVSFLAMQWAGISKYGVVHHFQNMIPPGLAHVAAAHHDPGRAAGHVHAPVRAS
jgi:F0F1-type ATP synthase membrane subunit a